VAFVLGAERYDAVAVVVYLWDQFLRDFAGRLLHDAEWALVFEDEKHQTVVFLRRVPRWGEVIAERERRP
jgi:hypothetical protein